MLIKVVVTTWRGIKLLGIISKVGLAQAFYHFRLLLTYIFIWQLITIIRSKQDLFGLFHAFLELLSCLF
jgi:hypothetical protein